MANEKIKMKKGASTNLPSVESGSLIFATDTGQAYLDISNTERIELKDTSKVTLETLASQISEAKKHSDIFDINYLYTNSKESPFTCTLSLSSDKDSSITSEDIMKDGAILVIQMLSSANSSEFGRTTFQIGSKSFITIESFHCNEGDCLIFRLSGFQVATFIGTLPKNSISAGDGLTFSDGQVSHNNYLTKGDSSTTYGGNTSSSATTSQTIDLSSGSATFNIPKIKPGKLGHVSEIENYAVTFSQLSGGSGGSSTGITVFTSRLDSYTDTEITLNWSSEINDENFFILTMDVKDTSEEQGFYQIDTVIIKDSHKEEHSFNTYGGLTGVGEDSFLCRLYKDRDLNLNFTIIGILPNNFIFNYDDENPIRREGDRNSGVAPMGAIYHKSNNIGETSYLNNLNLGGQLDYGGFFYSDKAVVDAYGHVQSITHNQYILPAAKRTDDLTDQTSAEFRNIIVVDSSVDVATLDVPVGTIIMVKN